MSGYNGDHLVEQPAIQRMQHKQGWDFVNCYDEGAVEEMGILNDGF